ncbi:hypothetical protein [Staphylococcus epidermidis]|uniref:hypothetical protein n=1 Tax=Staphylococcus epidermidis TaxID=1282 RepID=UPI001934A45A|nr:hypothetical protein [Staphylococcus epidermidis]MBM0772946.1 hypothetical protein [Staphylococcus epidermidis]
MLSKNAEKLLKELNTRKKEYLKNNKDSEKKSKKYYTVLNFSDIKELFEDETDISLYALLNYLLMENYIYNNVSNYLEKPKDYITKEDVDKDMVQILIGEKGIVYLNHKKYILLSKIIPICTAVLSLIISLITFIFK